MAFIGTPLDTRNTFQSLVGKRFNGDGSPTDFTLDVAPGSTLDIEVFVGNVRQDPNSAYTLSGTTLSFTGAPPSGTNNIYVVHQAKSVGTIDPPATESVAKTFSSTVSFTGAVTSSSTVQLGGTADMNGTELILDADADTSITADTDDQIDVKIAGADDFKFTANNFNILSGSTLTVDSGATITNSGTANGFGSRTLLQTTTISGVTANVSFSSTYITNSYKKYEIECIQCELQSTGYVSIYSSTDNGSNYDGAYDVTGAIFNSDGSSNSILTRNNTSSSDLTLLGNAVTMTNDKVFDLVIELFDPTSTTDYKNILFRGVYADTSNQAIVVYGGGSFDGEGTTAINNFKLQPGSGGFDAGVFKLYGVS